MNATRALAMRAVSFDRINFYFNNLIIFKKLASKAASIFSKMRFNFRFFRGILYYHLGQYEKAIADFSKALRLNWRDERVVLWIDRADRARRATLHRRVPLDQEMVRLLSVWDRPTCHRFAVTI